MINISKLYCGLAAASDDLRYAQRKEIRPIAVYNCTPRCNLRCLHCYSSSDADAAGDELDTAGAKKLIAQLAACACPVVLFSGGEPLLRADLFDLIEHAARLGLRVVLSTNGTLIDGKTAGKLAQLNLSYVGVSLDGPEDVHDRFRAKAGAFRAAMRGIENCRRVRIKTGIRFTITRENAPYVDSVFDIAADSGVRRLCFYHLVRTGRAQATEDHAADARRIREAIDRIIDRTDAFVQDDLVDEVLTVGNHADGPYLLSRMNRENHTLSAAAFNFLMAAGGNRTGQNIACINWDGAVFADQFWRNYPLGNIKERPFGRIWGDSNNPVLRILRNKSQFRDPRCAKCKWFELCRGNFRFLGDDAAIENWRNEPACYLTDEEIGA